MVSREALKTFLFQRPLFLSMMTSIPFLFFLFSSFSLFPGWCPQWPLPLSIFFSRQIIAWESCKRIMMKSIIQLWFDVKASIWIHVLNEYFSDYFNVFLSYWNIQKELRDHMKWVFFYIFSLEQNETNSRHLKNFCLNNSRLIIDSN